MSTRHRFQNGNLAALMVLGCLTVGEALWWNNARQSYPSFLIGDAPADANDLRALNNLCGEPLEIEPDTADKALVRCGTWWPARSIWSVPKAHVVPAIN